MNRYGFDREPTQASSSSPSTSTPTPATAATNKKEQKRLKKSIWLENKRSLKWLVMCENWAEWSTKRRKTVKRRVRKGVPDAMRGQMWQVFSGATVLRQRARTEGNRDAMFKAVVDQSNAKFLQINRLMEKAEVEQEQKFAAAQEQQQQQQQQQQQKQLDGTETKDFANQTPKASTFNTTTIQRDRLSLLSVDQKKARKWDAVIEADLGRTFPDHCMFHRNALGQKVLRDVLRAYAAAHPNLGYTQGMNFIAAMFISYMPARDAYWVLTAIMDSPKWDLQSMFCDRTPAVSRIWYQFDKLLTKYVPKVSAHFKQEGMDHSMYLTKWVIPLYTRDFHFDFVVRVWDIFLQQGWKIIFRVALALLKHSEPLLLKMDMEKIMYYLRDLPSAIDATNILTMAHRIKFKTKELEDLRLEYEQNLK
jgi:hypothetical protein